MLFSRVKISNPDTGDVDSGDVVCIFKQLRMCMEPIHTSLSCLSQSSLSPHPESPSLVSPSESNMLPESSAYLENTLQFHSSFKEAAVGLRTVKCVLVLKKHDMFDVATVAEGGVR